MYMYFTPTIAQLMSDVNLINQHFELQNTYNKKSRYMCFFVCVVFNNEMHYMNLLKYMLYVVN